MFIVGHVNKDGAIAGPKVREHIVDTVLYFEGDKMLPYRILRAAKNRYGSTNELGMFDMTGQGLEEFKQALLEIIRKEQIYIERLYDFSEAGKIQLIRSKGQLLSEEYVPEGIEVKGYVPQDT